VVSGTLYKNRSVVSFLQRLFDPILIIALHFLISAAFGKAADQAGMLLAVVTALLVVAIFPAVGIYRSHRTEPLTSQVPRLLAGWGLVAAALLLVGFLSKTTDMLPRRILLAWGLSTPAVLLTIHIALGYGLRRIRMRGRNTRVAIVVGAGETAVALAQRILSMPDWGLRLAGFFCADDEDPVSPHALGISGLGRLVDVVPYVRDNGVSHVYLALPPTATEQIATLLHELSDTTASVYLVPFVGSLRTFNFTVEQMDGMPLCALCETPFENELKLIAKRLTDLVFAGAALILLAPVLVGLAIGCKLSSPGPILFKQRRFGLQGREFLVFKFRTMTVMEDGAEIIQATRNDARCTPFGAFLRRTSLDELPQLVNVLMGTMSMVGPRPLSVAHNEQYRKLIEGYMVRHKVKPGITGWAQINGLRGETDTLDKMQRRVDYDLHYLEHWSLGFDIMILLKTPMVVVRGDGAY
jgi:putative colanic acid biosynthesis UDP-glucose lipid carrier transferase